MSVCVCTPRLEDLRMRTLHIYPPPLAAFSKIKEEGKLFSERLIIR